MSQAMAALSRVKARGAAVLSLHGRGLTWVSFRPIPGRACTMDLWMRRLPGLGLLSGKAGGIRHEHGGDRDDAEVSFHINRKGLSVVAALGREIALRDGEAMLFDNAVPRVISREDVVAHSVIRVPRQSLAPLVPRLDEVMLRPVPSGTGALRLLTSYAGSLVGDPALAVPGMRQMVAGHLCDLIAVTLGATRDAAALAERRGVAAARLRAIKCDIEAHLTEGDLSPAVVARRLGISESYLRRLFAGEGSSFSDFTLARRLARAHRLLGLPGWSERSIAAIAFEAGFGDISYFNRSFKRAFAATPSDVRRGAGKP